MKDRSTRRACIVVGRLDAIEHESGKLHSSSLDQGGGLAGRLNPDASDSKVLSSLQGQQVTVMGAVALRKLENSSLSRRGE